jgi:hypothetical protein
MGFGLEGQVGAQYNRGTNALSGFLDLDPAVGEGAALQGFFEHQFYDPGQEHVSRPLRGGGSRRAGGGWGGGGGGTWGPDGPSGYDFSAGAAAGGYTTAGGGTIAETSPVTVAPPNPNCVNSGGGD